MATQADVDNIKVERYDVYADNVNLGLTVDTTTSIELNETTVLVDNAEQLSGTVFALSTAIVPTVSMEFLRADFEFIKSKILAGRLETEVNGAYSNFHLGSKDRNLNELSVVLRLHPAGISLTDTSRDVLFHKAAAIVEGLSLVGSRTQAQTFTVSWRILPDLSKASGREFGVFGSWDITEATPLGVFIAMDKFLHIPYKHLTAITLTPSQVDRLRAFAFFLDIAGTATALINLLAGYTATDTSLEFDTLSTANAIVADSFIRIGTETLYVVSVTYATSTSGTLVVVRGTNGSTAAAILDNAAITVGESPNWKDVRDSGDWLSSVPADVTVGDSYANNTKGVITNITPGASNITATYGSVSSPNTVVTAT